MSTALFIAFLLAAGGLLGIMAWKFFGVLSKEQAFFATAVLLVAGLTGVSWEYSHFLAGALLLLLGSIVTTVYLEKSLQKV